MNGNTQVSATELNLMPIPRCDQESQVAALARQLQDTPAGTVATSLEQRLNEQVAEAYGLLPGELGFIQLDCRRAVQRYPLRQSLPRW
jgi:hypothetical protein